MRSVPGDEVPTLGRKAGTEDMALALRIIGDALFASHLLPASGDMVVGRGTDSDICVDDPSVSRRHAILHIGASLAVEDLGSANGTRIRGQRIVAGDRVDIARGEAIEVGSVILIVQPTTEVVVAAAAAAAERVTSVRSEPDVARPSARDAIGAGAATSPPPPNGAAASAPLVFDRANPQLARLVDRVAAATISVLLLGETGVGKEVTAELIHARSPRKDHALVRINCAALSEALLESELFGFEKGAFTGASQQKLGLIETADGGTLFLDEIGELPLTLQAKLLRVSQDRQVLRVGGLAPRAVDVRFISATNRDLEAEVARGTFRRDLFFRLNGIALVIPPLRERVAEIEPLADTFLEELSGRMGRPPPTLSHAARSWLRSHAWPGNVRELRNVIERALLLCTGDAIAPEHLSPMSAVSAASVAPAVVSQQDPERQRVLDALARCAGNQTQAAKVLGISRGTLVSRLEAYGVPRPKKRV